MPYRPAAAFLLAASGLLAATSTPLHAQDEPPVHLLLVSLDGLRWEEVFGGADSSIVFAPDSSGSPARRWWRPSRAERRAALMPFLWEVMVEQGQLLGDVTRGAGVRVTNGRNFSYPGYQELLAGWPDDSITSNDTIPNRNVTVLEWLNRQPGLAGRVAASASWSAFPWIINTWRSGVPVLARPDSGPSAGVAMLLPTLWSTTRLDLVTHLDALSLVADGAPPRVLYVALGETDEWAHAGDYAQYLDAAHRNDAMIRELVEAWGSHPAVAGRLAVLVTVDHGRGPGPDGFDDHGADVPGAEWVWVAAMGPGVPPLGVREGVPGLTQAQVAATAAHLLGLDWPAAEPRAAPPLPLDP